MQNDKSAEFETRRMSCKVIRSGRIFAEVDLQKSQGIVVYLSISIYLYSKANIELCTAQ